MPDYQYAVDRIAMFENEQKDWDGCGGLPASPSVAAEVRKFLAAAQKEGIEVPSLAMGGDGSVAVVWNDHGVYISADFDGTPEYSFMVAQGDDFLASGVCVSDKVDDRLVKHLRNKFMHQH
jgi:hypothetical protein